MSVVTPSFNHGPYLEKTIRSVLLQGYPDLEYIIIDGGSNDGTVEILRKYQRWLAYWVSECDRGHGEAINKGVAQASGEALVIMPSDDFYYPKGLSTLVQLRGRRPDAVCWVGAMPSVDEDGNLLYPGKPFINDINRIGDWGNATYLGCPSVLIDMAAFRQVGGIDERFHVASDVELWIRLSKIGSFALTDEKVSEARQVTGSVTNRDRLELVAAMIALNYIHGYRDIAKSTLARYPQYEEPFFKLVVRRMRRGLKQRMMRLLRLQQK